MLNINVFLKTLWVFPEVPDWLYKYDLRGINYQDTVNFLFAEISQRDQQLAIEPTLCTVYPFEDVLSHWDGI